MSILRSQGRFVYDLWMASWRIVICLHDDTHDYTVAMEHARLMVGRIKIKSELHYGYCFNKKKNR
jgi:hypothetical protein